MKKVVNESDVFKTGAYCVIATGVLLSLIQFFSNRSLWLDEAYLALNIIEKSPEQLLQPLANSQVAPPLFLLVEKALFHVIPFPDQALRLFPLLSYWAALYFFFQLSRRFLRQPSSQLLAVSLFTLSGAMLYFSSEVKQYMTDVAVLNGIYFVATKEYAETNKKYIWLLFCGTAAIFLSNVGILILFTVGVYLLTFVKNKTDYGWIFLTGGIWVVFFGINYSLFIHDHPTRAFMLNYWSRKNAFMPFNPLSLDFIHFAINKSKSLYALLTGPFKISGSIILTSLTIAGTFTLFWENRNKAVMWLLLMPIPLHLVLSALKIYPFEARLILYTIPVVVLLIGLGWEFLLLKLSESSRTSIQYVPVLFPFISLAGLYLDGFPIQRQEIKENIGYYNQNALPSQGLYVGTGAKFITLYYIRTNFFKAKGNIQLSKIKQKKHGYNSILNELCQLRGQHWLLLNEKYLDPVPRIIKSLDSLQIPRLDAHFSKNSSLLLYDFGSGCPQR